MAGCGHNYYEENKEEAEHAADDARTAAVKAIIFGGRAKAEKASFDPEQPFRILVVGECGDGKSTVIKAFLKTYGGKWTKELQTGVTATGVSKEVVAYPITIGGRRAEIFDTPGVGDGTVKIPHLVAAIEVALKKNQCHAIMICSQMGKNRVGLGAQIVASLIKSGIVEKNQKGHVHENIIFVGTQLDLYVGGCKTEEKKRKKIAKWDKEVPKDMNRRCGFTGKDSIRFCHTSIIIDDDEPMDQEDMEIDISEPSKALLEIMRAGRSVTYHKPDSESLVQMFAEETGLDLEEKKLKEMAAELEAARKKLEEMQNRTWWNTLKDVASTALGGAAGFAAGGPIGALLGLSAGLGGSKVDSAIRKS